MCDVPNKAVFEDLLYQVTMKNCHVLLIGFSLVLGVNSVVNHNEYVVPFGQNGASFVSETSSVDFKPGGFSKSVSFGTHSQDGGYGSGPMIDNDFYGKGLPRFRFGNNFVHNSGYNRFNPGYLNFPVFDSDFGSDFDFDLYGNNDFLEPDFQSIFPPFLRNRFSRFPTHFMPSFIGSPASLNPFYNSPPFNYPLLPRQPILGNNFGYGYNKRRLLENVDDYEVNNRVKSPYDIFRPF